MSTDKVPAKWLIRSKKSLLGLVKVNCDSCVQTCKYKMAVAPIEREGKVLLGLECGIVRIIEDHRSEPAKT